MKVTQLWNISVTSLWLTIAYARTLAEIKTTKAAVQGVTFHGQSKINSYNRGNIEGAQIMEQQTGEQGTAVAIAVAVASGTNMADVQQAVSQHERRVIKKHAKKFIPLTALLLLTVLLTNKLKFLVLAIATAFIFFRHDGDPLLIIDVLGLIKVSGWTSKLTYLMEMLLRINGLNRFLGGSYDAIMSCFIVASCLLDI